MCLQNYSSVKFVPNQIAATLENCELPDLLNALAVICIIFFFTIPGQARGAVQHGHRALWKMVNSNCA